ncbi:methylated-DNA--[protein]-cysteine S-methyltransferase [Rubrolithibacter danxiaensis]|uniref:methylated-DNA--[protein]-cysteine S-methyltransferase n=1 Tax=Rubrolithibacter danxiaensis TaxID=3390805 RepID=UPI003BF81817
MLKNKDLLPEFVSILSCAIGDLAIKADEKNVFFIGFDQEIRSENPNVISNLAKQQLEEYFAGKRSVFDFPIVQPGTEFQQKVWAELLNIPPGTPISYAALSKRMNNPLAIRAIAAANGKNNLMIVVPCHRVIGSSGDLVGYAGGLWRKKWLLDHEAKLTRKGQASLNL